MIFRLTAKMTLACLTAVFVYSQEVRAEDRLAYTIQLAGIDVGDMEIAVERAGDRYDAKLDGRYSILFWSGSWLSQSFGTVDPNGPVPSRFQSNSESDEPAVTVINFKDPDGPVDWRRTPPAPAEWTEGRLPLQKQHLRTALDPVSALAASVLGSVGGQSPDVCKRAVRIFTGTVVFELDFRGAKPARGNRVMCDVAYRPLSGHRQDSGSVERLSEPGSIEISFDRLPDGGWLPSRVSLPTPIGSLVVERS
ncbi:MAG: DUF3108 domain-containing protein [Pseudomonadota bacterium]